MYFEKKSNLRSTVRQHVDPSLIAGVRLQSDYFLWEHSIAKQLRDLKRNVLG
jgi:F0F1-type ATP synthase delta subunit